MISAAETVLAGRGVNRPDSASVGRVPGFNIPDHEGKTRRVDCKRHLVSTAGRGVAATKIALSVVNVERKSKGLELIPVPTVKQFQSYGRKALSDDALHAIEVAELPTSNNDNDLVLLPGVPAMPEGASWANEEVVGLYEAAGAHTGVPLWEWIQRLNFLKLWTPELLLGLDERANVGELSGAVTSTLYDRKNIASCTVQRQKLKDLQKQYPGIVDMRLFHGAALACIGEQGVWADSHANYVRLIGLESMVFEGIVCVPVGEVVEQVADVNMSITAMMFGDCSPGRRGVRLEPLALT